MPHVVRSPIPKRLFERPGARRRKLDKRPNRQTMRLIERRRKDREARKRQLRLTRR